MVAAGLPTSLDGRIEVERGKAWYAANIEQDRRKALREASPVSTGEELKRLKVERERLALDRARGNLIDRAEAERAIFTRARAERDGLLGWAARVAPALAAKLGTDPALTFTALDAEVRAFLAKLAETPLEGLTDG